MWATWVCTCLLLSCNPVSAQPEPAKVLILNSFEEDSGPYYQPIQQFEKALEQAHEGVIVFRRLDLMYKGSTEEDRTGESIAQLLLSRYADDPPNLVVAVGPAAIDFWVTHRDAIFPDALLLAAARLSYLQKTKLRPSDAEVATEFSFTSVAEDILQLFPETSNIVMVFGNTFTERTLAAEARQQLAALSGMLTLDFTNDLSISEIQDKLASLSAGSVVFLGFFSEDVNGIALQHNSDIAMVRAVSTVPVFGPFDNFLGKGIVGGRLIPIGATGRGMAEVAQGLLGGNSLASGRTIIHLTIPTYDWRELQTWGVDSNRLPPGSKVLYQPPGFWERYAIWIIVFAIVFVTQSIWLVALLTQNLRRREAEGARTSLGRRLITAHEDERRLLARELHDDLSQRLARASIDVGIVASSPGSEAAKQALDYLGPELIRISKDVHDMSYRLHPSLVEDLGITAALNAECDRVSRRTSAELIRDFGSIPDHISIDAMLCVFRIAQEALNNAIRHAQASRIVISLHCEQGRLQLEVDDNGVGFDNTGNIGHSSLGLSSMRERVALLRGSLEIHSKVGNGTRISVAVPIDASAG
jgi:signal transduction histidine kinase